MYCEYCHRQIKEIDRHGGCTNCGAPSNNNNKNIEFSYGCYNGKPIKDISPVSGSNYKMEIDNMDGTYSQLIIDITKQWKTFIYDIGNSLRPVILR